MITTARQMLGNIQSCLSIILSVHDRHYVNRYPLGGGDVIDRLTGDLIYTEEMPGAFSPSVDATIGSLSIINTPDAPLVDEFGFSFQGVPYTLSVCGVVNEGMANAQNVSFDDRLTLLSGFADGATKSTGNFQLSLKTIPSALGRNLLETTDQESGVLLARDFQFSADSSTQVSSGNDVTVSISNATINSQIITLDFDVPLDELVLTLDSDQSTITDTRYDFQGDLTKLTSQAGIEMSVELLDTGSSPVVKISSPSSLSDMTWVFRNVAFETISNWSIAPNIIDPPFPNEGNSELQWSNMGGVNEITFTIDPVQTPARLYPDEHGRVYLYAAMKMWPLSVTEARRSVSDLFFSTAPNIQPAADEGLYVWRNLSTNQLEINGTFRGVSINDPLSISVDGAQVVISNTESTVRLKFSRILKNTDGERSKRVTLPLVFGEDCKNCQAVKIKREVYSFGSNVSQVNTVRINGDVIPKEEIIFEFDANDDNGVVSWRPDGGGTIVISAASLDMNVTGDVSSSDVFFGEMISHLCTLAGMPFGGVGSDFLLHKITQRFDSQLNLKQALNTILPPLDAFYVVRDGLLIVYDRSEYTEFFGVEFDANVDVIPGTINVSRELPRYHEMVVLYDRVWSVDQNDSELSQQFKDVADNDQGVEFIGAPEDGVPSGSFTKTVETCLVDVESANKLLEMKFKRERKRQLPFQFYLQNRGWVAEVNKPIRVNNSFLNKGMLLPLKVMEVKKTKQTFVSGVWYVD